MAEESANEELRGRAGGRRQGDPRRLVGLVGLVGLARLPAHARLVDPHHLLALRPRAALLLGSFWRAARQLK